MSDRLRERRSSVPMQRVRAAETAYNPHLGSRVAGHEYNPKYTHEELDALVDDIKAQQRPAVFDHTGALVTDAVSDPDVSAFPRHYRRMTTALKTAGSTTATVAILVDGTAVAGAQVDMPSTATVSIAVDVKVPALAKLTAKVINQGTNAEGCGVVLE